MIEHQSSCNSCRMVATIEWALAMEDRTGRMSRIGAQADIVHRKERIYHVGEKQHIMNPLMNDVLTSFARVPFLTGIEPDETNGTGHRPAFRAIFLRQEYLTDGQLDEFSQVTARRGDGVQSVADQVVEARSQMRWKQSIVCRPVPVPGRTLNEVFRRPGVIECNGDTIGLPLKRGPRLKVAERREVLVSQTRGCCRPMPRGRCNRIDRIDHP